MGLKPREHKKDQEHIRERFDLQLIAGIIRNVLAVRERMIESTCEEVPKIIALSHRERFPKVNNVFWNGCLTVTHFTKTKTN